VFVELIEHLRCPRPHDESSLIATASRTRERHIVDGLLGCPVCGAEFGIENGVAHFAEPAAPTQRDAPNAETQVRLAAFLDLTTPHGFTILCGRWGAQADGILRLADVRLVLVNPPADVPPDVAAAVIRTRDVVPFAPGSAQGVALHTTSALLVDSAVQAVRAGGRVVGAASLAMPATVTELTRDAEMWIAERNAVPDRYPPGLVSLKRSSRS